MVPFSGWIKYLLRWALLIILFLQCLKRSQAPAFWKQLSLACTWRMYESDTSFFYHHPPAPRTGNSWIRAMKILDFCDQLLDSGKKKEKNPFDTLLVSRILVYIVTYYCKVDLQGLVQQGTTEPKTTICRTEFLKDHPVAGTLTLSFFPTFSARCFPLCPLGLRADVGEVCFLQAACSTF